MPYNLLSVSKVTESGKVVKFSDASSKILDKKQKLIATATRVEYLYYLIVRLMANKFIELRTKKQIVWHQRFHHLGTQNPHKLAKENLVDGFDYNSAKESVFCESCA